MAKRPRWVHPDAVTVPDGTPAEVIAFLTPFLTDPEASVETDGYEPHRVYTRRPETDDERRARERDERQKRKMRRW